MKTALASESDGGSAVTHRAGRVHDGVQGCLDCGFEFPVDPDGAGFVPGYWIHTRASSGYELRRPSLTLGIQAKRCTSSPRP